MEGAGNADEPAAPGLAEKIWALASVRIRANPIMTKMYCVSVVMDFNFLLCPLTTTANNIDL